MMPDPNDTRERSRSRPRTDESPVSWQTALDKFLIGVRREYGPRVQRLVLYGSRARGDAEPDSDVDVLVVLDECSDLWREHHRLGGIAYDASLGAETIISAHPIAREDFDHRQSPLLLNVRREGIDLA